MKFKSFIICLVLVALSFLSLATTYQKVNWEVHFSPNNENEKTVVEFIDKASSSLRVAAYSLTNSAIGEAIKNSREKIGNVFVICDKQQAQIKSALCKEVQGKIDKKSGLMHNKFIVQDNACVLTGSFNFTNNAIKTNRENFIIICHPEIASIYRKEFDRLWRENT